MSGIDKVRKAKLLAELHALKRQDGIYAAADVVEFARDHPKSELHKQFNWNKDEAAYEHWLLTARHLITIYVVVRSKNSPTVIVPVISIPSMRREGGSYASRDVLSSNEQWRQDCLAEEKTWFLSQAEKWEPVLPELNPVWKAIRKTC